MTRRSKWARLQQDQDPVETREPGDDFVTFDHPAFGNIRAARVSGETTLHGSDFIHHNFVVLWVSRADYRRGLSNDWHHPGKDLVEVHLSEAQWATFVSSLNVGNGVPCTLHRVDGELMPSIPLRQVRDVATAEFDAKARDLAATVKAAMAAVDTELGGLSQKKRDLVMKHLEKLARELGANMPFMAEQFGEHMEAVTEKAKVEVNAYIQATLTRAGMAHLAADGGPLLLSSGTDQARTDD